VRDKRKVRTAAPMVFPHAMAPPPFLAGEPERYRNETDIAVVEQWKRQCLESPPSPTAK
jgi:hypothetical protein